MLCVKFSVLLREISDPSKTAGEALHTLAREVVEVMKGVCGREEFSRGYSLAHRRALSAREKRRKQAALEVCVGVGVKSQPQLNAHPSLPPSLTGGHESGEDYSQTSEEAPAHEGQQTSQDPLPQTGRHRSSQEN